MNSLNNNLKQVRLEMSAAERQFGREPGSVKLLAVSKTRAAADVLALAQLGVADFGENYVQEALAKIEQIKEHSLTPGSQHPAMRSRHAKIEQLSGDSLTWHFIGPIQSQQVPPDRNAFRLGALGGPYPGCRAIERGSLPGAAATEYLHTG